MKQNDIRLIKITETGENGYFFIRYFDKKENWPDSILISDFVAWHREIEPELYKSFSVERAIKLIWSKDIAAYINTKILQDAANTRGV